MIKIDKRIVKSGGGKRIKVTTKTIEKQFMPMSNREARRKAGYGSVPMMKKIVDLLSDLRGAGFPRSGIPKIMNRRNRKYLTGYHSQLIQLARSIV